MTKDAAKARRWELLLEADTARYDADPLWSSNGIISNVGCEYHPWMCQHCAKVFSSLHDCIAHCATVAHQNNLWYPYTLNDLPLPAVPQWSTMGVNGAAHARMRLMDGGSPNPGGTPSGAAPPERPALVADLQARSSTASAGTPSYRVRLVDATFNGHPIPNAVLVVFDPRAEAPSQDAAYVMTDAQICGDFQAANGLPADGLPPFVRPSPVPTGDLVDGDSLSSRRPMPRSGSAPATSAAPVQVQSGQLINGGHLSDMIPTTTHRRRPGLPMCADVGAADVRAAAVWPEGWRRQQRLRVRNDALDSSDENGGMPAWQPKW